METSAKSRFRQSPPPAFRRIIRRSAAVLLQVIAILSLNFRAAAQTPPPAPAPTLAVSQAPTIAFDQAFFDFGEIHHGQTVAHRFKVSNTGNSTLHIKEVHANCGCTFTVVGKMVLEPGERTEIEADFTPENAFSGAVRKTILVISDDPAHSKLTLRFAADVLPDAPASQPAQ